MNINDLNKSILNSDYVKGFYEFTLYGGVKTAILRHCIGDRENNVWTEFIKDLANK